MLDPVRRIVSGRKARYTEGGFDLDLVQLTERIIIMGYPAEGFASLYRNKRSDVLRFLEPYEGHYRIFNLCPRSENSYDAAAMTHHGGESAVQRFPWPDHHPPPLSLIPLMVDAVRRWYDADERNVVVIHCKAGKGRSGSFALAFLLSLPGLPSAPPLSSSEEAAREDDYGPMDPRAVLGKSGAEVKDLTMPQKLEYLLRFHTTRRMAPGAKSYGVSIASQRRMLGYWSRLLEGDDPHVGDHKPQRIVLEYVKLTGPGLSGVGKVVGGGKDQVAVQVWRYKDSIAASLRSRELALASGNQADWNDDDWDDKGDMLVHVGGLVEQASAHAPTASDDTSAPERAMSPPVASAHGTDSVASTSTGSLPSAVLDAPSTTPYSSNSSEASLPPPSASSAHPPSPSVPRERTLVPSTSFLPVPPSQLDGPSAPQPRSREEAKRAVEADGGIVLDAEREAQLRVLVGKTGEKHGKLPVMASLALTWFIPVFEVATPSNDTAGSCRSKVVIQGKDLDFRKPFAGIEALEVGWRWLD
ncbi:hypothetical protein Rhopal_006285-T1 [Rhodotorula paludigena]|uniref:phosphatidylinositol-3,4,5-trisphosphate 3-phosphatase n=1 Tax=Rhodotorula paludigena TaxID=86838 RepID=A0AAV5GSM3_9BASI|nr:hypothetical protein Rhopal_006285-T1 [Rhodotorula paludigena]